MQIVDSKLTRRSALVAGAAALSLTVRPERATAEELAAVVRQFTGGAVHRAGRVKFEIAPLVENGNAVPITVSAESPMTASDHVVTIAVFNERNPQRDVGKFHFTPRSGRASVTTRIRLATSQQLIAVAKMSDGSFWSASVDVEVTLAACVE